MVAVLPPAECPFQQIYFEMCTMCAATKIIKAFNLVSHCKWAKIKWNEIKLWNLWSPGGSGFTHLVIQTAKMTVQRATTHSFLFHERFFSMWWWNLKREDQSHTCSPYWTETRLEWELEWYKRWHFHFWLTQTPQTAESSIRGCH